MSDNDLNTSPVKKLKVAVDSFLTNFADRVTSDNQQKDMAAGQGKVVAQFISLLFCSHVERQLCTWLSRAEAQEKHGAQGERDAIFQSRSTITSAEDACTELGRNNRPQFW